MSYKSKNLIQNLVESRRQESIRIHTQYISALEITKESERRMKDILKTILSDLPVDEEVIPHNFD